RPLPRPANDRSRSARPGSPWVVVSPPRPDSGRTRLPRRPVRPAIARGCAPQPTLGRHLTASRRARISSARSACLHLAGDAPRARYRVASPWRERSSQPHSRPQPLRERASAARSAPREFAAATKLERRPLCGGGPALGVGGGSGPGGAWRRPGWPSAAGGGLGRAEDAGGALLLFLLFALLAVGGDDDALAGGELAPVEAGLDLFGVEGLSFEEGVGEEVELVAVLFDDLDRERILGVDDLAQLLVDIPRGLLGVVV